MKKQIMITTFFMLFYTYLFSYTSNDLKFAKIKLIDNGYVFFEGFDFDNYDKSYPELESMLERTYKIIKDKYGNKKINNNKGELIPEPFVFVGHSQGGLRALAMSSYLKEKDANLYKQLKGVYTISGIDKGLKLLENNGANFRVNLYNDVQILTKGVYGTVKVFDFTPGNFVYDYVINSLAGDYLSLGVYNLGKWLLCDCLSITSNFSYPIMNNTGWNEYTQIRDMCPQSDFIKKYVLEERSVTCKHKSEKKKTTAIEMRKGWLGIKYPVIVTKYEPKLFITNEINMKIDKDLYLEFYIGTKSDSLSMAPQNIAKNVDKGMNAASTVFRVAEVAHIAKCAFLIGLVTNSPAYAYDCDRAADWCGDYKSQINELIGEKVNDGLVAYDSQHLPTMSKINSDEEERILLYTKIKDCYANHEEIATKKDSDKEHDYRGMLDDSVKARLNEIINE